MAILAQLMDDVVVHKFELITEEFHLGRHPDCDVVVDDGAVSGRHALISVKPNAHFPQFKEFYIQDLGSTNGTYLNEARINGIKRLHHNDVIRVAWNKFKFIDDKEADLEATLHML